MLRGNSGSAAGAARARSGFDAAAFLQAKLFFRPEQLVTFLGWLGPAESFAHRGLFRDTALPLHTSERVALTALGARGTIGAALEVARCLGECHRRRHEQQRGGETGHMDTTARRAGGSASVARLAHHLNAACLRAVFALLGGKAHFGADREALELDVQHAVGMEVELPVVVQRPDEAVAFVGEQLLDHAVRLAVVDLCIAPALLDRPLQLLLDGAEGLVDERRQLGLHVADLLLLLHREVVLPRYAHLDHHAVVVALAVRGLLARQCHVAAREVLRKPLQVSKPLGNIALYPGAAIDAVEDYFRRKLHGTSMFLCEKLADFAVRGLAEVGVPVADGVTILGRARSHHVLPEPAHAHAGIGGAGGHGDHDPRRVELAQRLDRRFHRRAGGEAIVDQDDGLAGNRQRLAAAAISFFASPPLRELLVRGLLDRGLPDAVPRNNAGIDDAHAAGRDRAHRQLAMARPAELPHDEDVERRAPAPPHLVADRHTASRQRQDHDVVAVLVAL